MTQIARLEAGPLRVTFERCDDRYGHRVEFLEAESAILLLQSMEGTPDEDWPASPALKELHLEERPGGRQLALLVGMAGRSHWSLSVELDPTAGQVMFDVACRVRDEPRQLASAYRVMNMPVRLLADPPRLGLSHGLELLPQAIDQGVAELTPPAPDLINVQAHIGTGKYPRTVRWRYVIRSAISPNTDR